MAYTKYSLTPANNTSAPPDGAPEGMLPSAVNDTMRDMMAQIRDCGDGVRDGTYTMTAPKITGGTITGVTLTGNTLSSPVISGGTINNATIGATTASTGAFSTLTNGALTSGRVTYAGASGLLSDSANLNFNGTNLLVGRTTSDANGWGIQNYSAASAYATGIQMVYGGVGAAAIWIPAASSLSFGADGGAGTTERMRLTSTGLGIGTSSPATTLDIVGTARISGTSGTGYQGFRMFGTGTAYNYMQMDNTGGVINFGIENSSGGAILAGTSAYATVLSSYSNTAIQFGTNNTLRATLDTSGNLGLGVTPSAWFAGAKVFEFGSKGNTLTSGSAVQTLLTSNAFFDSSWKYGTTGAAAFYELNSGSHKWSIAASGTAGNTISFTQAMTLDADGNFLLGNTVASSATNAGFKFLKSIEGVGNDRTSIVFASSSDAQIPFALYSTGAGAYRFYVGAGGTISATSIVISAISDQRLKENIRDIDTGLLTIMALKPRRFDWKEGKGQDKKNVAGFIAQEFEDVFPECVSTAKAGEDGIEYKNINHETLIPTLVKAIQELKTEFDAYKTTHP